MTQNKKTNNSSSSKSAKTSPKKTTSSGKKTSSSAKKTAKSTSTSSLKSSTKKTNKTTTNKSNKKTDTKKSSSTGSSSRKKSTDISEPIAAKKTANSAVRKEIIGVLTIAFSIFLIFSLNSDDSMGIFGNAIRNASYILFGKGMFIVSFVFLLVGILHLVNYIYYSEKKQNLSVAGIFLCCLVFICMYDIAHGASGIFTSKSPFKEVLDFSINYNESHVFGGGIIGNILCWLNLKLFGKVGTYIIFSALTLIFTIIFTNQSLIGFFKMIGKFIMKFLRGISNFIFIEEEVDDDEDLAEPQSDKKIIADDSTDKAAASKKPLQKKKNSSAIKTVNTAIYVADDIDLFEFEDVKVDLKTTSKSKKAKDITKLELEDGKIADSKKNILGTEFIDNDINSPCIEDKPIKKHPVNEDIIINDYQSNYTDNNINFFGGKVDKVDPDKKAPDQSVINDKRIISKPINIQEKINLDELKSNDDSLVDEKAEEETAYVFPPVNLLDNPHRSNISAKEDLKQDAEKLIQTLKNFGVDSKLIQISRGPTITRYELAPAPGIKVSKITGLADDIALSLAAQDVRIEAPIPGKSAVGIEIPNKVKNPVVLKSLLNSKEYDSEKSNIPFALGQDIAGQNIVADISKMPHLLIAGATGSGKSVCINTLIMSILYKAHPADVKLILIDPKVVELSVYNGIPHLLIPVVTDPRKASNALNWAVNEMDNRYKLFAQNSVRDIHSFNKKMFKENKPAEKMSQMVIIIDELADLMQVASKEVEDSITRIAQLARACGIHLVIATQRPSVDVITGTIKANIPSRIAFAVSSYIDSRTILDSSGAEKLLGKGDMFYHPIGEPKPTRIQCSFVSDDEIKRVVDFISSQKVQNNYSQKSEVTKEPERSEEVDEYLEQAIIMATDRDTISASMLQRSLPIGFNRAAKLLDSMEERGIISGPNGYKPRKVLVTKDELGIDN